MDPKAAKRTARLPGTVLLVAAMLFSVTIVLTEDPKKRTMAGALQSFVGKYRTDLVLLNAGSVLLLAPTILVVLLMHRHFVKAVLQRSYQGLALPSRPGPYPATWPSAHPYSP